MYLGTLFVFMTGLSNFLEAVGGSPMQWSIPPYSLVWVWVFFIVFGLILFVAGLWHFNSS